MDGFLGDGKNLENSANFLPFSLKMWPKVWHLITKYESIPFGAGFHAPRNTVTKVIGLIA